jgi:hypothetical protein
MQILSHFWGEKHVEIFKNTALRSLTWPNNLAALKGSTWNIFTEEKFFNELSELIPNNVSMFFRPTSELMEFIDPAQSAFMWQMRRCLELEEKLLIAPADLILGDGTVGNMLTIGQDKGSVVMVPHMRVLPEAMNEIARPTSNAELVNLAFKYLHRSWVDAERGAPHNTSYHGGVEWERLGPNLYSVNHRLPAPYLIDFTKEDLDYFESAPTFNSLDHCWPGDVLVPRGRQRYVGSSDACFLIEPTEAESNIPNLLDYAVPGGFCRNMAHNQMNSMVRAIFRGE